jgi:hydrogenase-1 operon protein HyaF
VQAILSELVTLLVRLKEKEETGLIDLLSLPMSPLDRKELKRVLGDGEVHAMLDAEGPSQFQETSVPGIWWIEHRDRQGKLIAELIEVALIPEILKCDRAEIAGAATLLNQRVQGMRAPAKESEHVER